MARRIRIPGLVDLLRVSDAEEIRALNAEPCIDRNFIARGPLINRLIVARIRRWFRISGQFLPSLARRADAARSDSQQGLARSLDPARHALWTDAQIERLADFVGSKADPDSDAAEDMAVVVQEIVGRLFDQEYAADRASWRAAELIDRFRDGVSPVQIIWLITGRLRHARDLLVERARDDRWAMHGTAIGLHGIVHALHRMRTLRAAPEAASLSDDAMLARCLDPPMQVPRTVEAVLSTPVTADRLRPGALVLLQLRAAAQRAPGPEMTFMQSRWNACPAQAFVIELLKAVWRRSLGVVGADATGHPLHAAAVP